VERLLETKFHIPPTRPELVKRPRLIKRLTEGLHCKLTLISAPAGFGKTTLVSEWATYITSATTGENLPDLRIAWLSLDESDNELVRFLIYLTTALKHIPLVKSAIGDETLEILQSPQPPSVETVMTSLLNEVAKISPKIVLILDDYHLIEIQPIHAALAYLLEHAPAQLNLVIVTREDPLIPLARLRARCQLTELRGADLRFTPSEAAEFLNQVMGLDLTTEDVTALENRTEGWITGLQLAAVSLQGQLDKSKLIRSFAGSHRFVLDYLVEDVLSHQSKSLQDFLVRTSILKQLTGSLCDALTDQDNGQATLELLDRANLFIVPLDNERHWYRYHHLFAELLRLHLQETPSVQQPALHLRASQWYENNGFTEQAIEHSLRAGDFERAAVLAELAWPEMHMSYQGPTWLAWVKEIPDELVRARPVLSTGYGWSLIDTGDLEKAALYLQDAERWLEARATMNKNPANPADRQGLADEKALRSLTASVANARAYLSQALGDVAATEKYTYRALDLLPEDEYFERGLSAVMQGFAYWSSGNLEAAHRAISEAISNMQILGKVAFIISFTSYLADIMVAQGHLNEAKKIYLQLLDMSVQQGEPEIKEIAVLHLGLSEIALEQGDQQAARKHLLKSDQLGRLPTFSPWYRHWVLAHIRMKQAEGDLQAVMKILNDAKSLYYRHPIPDVHPLKALIARAQLLMGNFPQALHWVHEQNLSVDDDLSYLHEFEHLTLARVLISQYRRDSDEALIQGVIHLLERLLKVAEEGSRTGSVTEILILQALASDAKGEIFQALVPLERALRLAEPQGYLRLFVDEGPPMAGMLYEALSRGISPNYVRRLIAAFPFPESEQVSLSTNQNNELKLIEPLSEREIEVLKLIAKGLTNQVIATRLYLSLNTVKVHTRNIYGKLGVNSRTQAVAQARALGILSEA
jgi:LuxR family maltose regulon positive regulatory protein